MAKIPRKKKGKKLQTRIYTVYELTLSLNMNGKSALNVTNKRINKNVSCYFAVVAELKKTLKGSLP